MHKQASAALLALFMPLSNIGHITRQYEPPSASAGALGKGTRTINMIIMTAIRNRNRNKNNSNTRTENENENETATPPLPLPSHLPATKQDNLAAAQHLANALQTLTGCQVCFEPLKDTGGYYLFNPGPAADTFILVSIDLLRFGSFMDIWQTIVGLASYHLAIGPDDWRRVFGIEATYTDGQLIGPYHDKFNLESTFIFLSGLLLQEAGICPLGFCEQHPQTHDEKARVWMVRGQGQGQGQSQDAAAELRPTISGDLYHILS